MPPHCVVRLRPFVAILIRRDRHLRVVVVRVRNRNIRRVCHEIIPAAQHSPSLVKIRTALHRIRRVNLRRADCTHRLDGRGWSITYLYYFRY